MFYLIRYFFSGSVIEFWVCAGKNLGRKNCNPDLRMGGGCES